LETETSVIAPDEMPKIEDNPSLNASSCVDVQSDTEYPIKYIIPCSEALAGGGVGDGGGGLGGGGGASASQYSQRSDKSVV